MVADDDPHFMRFWAIYPHHIAKQDARKAWAQLSPTTELVDRMIEALTWQVALWAKQGYGTPYPASWLRAERWTDEPPPPVPDKRLPEWAR
jgi:hypothetical protein